ncbi:MAG: GNAT family N-acetyltransferase, partial [Anaerohalosphaeraceae bacterium]
VAWKDKKSEIYFVRKTVFVDEQNVPPEIEIDENDPLCQHVLASNQDNQPIGTGRIDSKGKIGRMAVLSMYRAKGVGRSILDTLIQYGRNAGLRHFYLSAQLHAVGFYEKAGFTAYGEAFEEAGIMHIMMEKNDSR